LINMKTRWWMIAVVMLVCACGNNDSAAVTEPADDLGIKSAEQKRKENLAMIADAKPLIQDGDLILRSGTDFSSEQIKLISKKDRTYSHGGIAFRRNGEVYVYHVISDYYHKNDKVFAEKLDSFCNPASNLGFAVARYDLDSAEVGRFHQYLDKQVRDKVAFDMRFDIRTNDSLYCSEMIAKGLKQATNGRLQLEIGKFGDRSMYKVIKQHLKLTDKELDGREIVPIDHLFLHPQCQVLKRYVYEQ